MKTRRLPLASALVLLLAACGGAAAPASRPSQAAAKPASSAPAARLRVGFGQIIPQYLPLWVAQEAGIYAKNGLAVEQNVATSTTGMAALLSGELDLIVTGGSELLNASVNGADLVALGNLAPVSAFKFEVASGIKTKDDLVGKKIGVTRFGSTTDTAARALLRNIGLNPDKDVTFIQLENTAGVTAGLVSGNAQAALRTPPETLKVEAQGFHSLYDLAEMKVPDTSSVVVTTRAWLNSHHEVAQAFIDSLVAGIARLKHDKPLAIAQLRKNLKLDDEVALNSVYDYFGSSVFAPVPEAQPEQFVDVVSVINAQSPKIKDADVLRVIDNSFVKSAQDRGLANG